MLKSYYGKHVTIFATNGRLFQGMVDDYFFPDENDDGEESIVLTTDNGLVEFKNTDIERITINQ